MNSRNKSVVRNRYITCGINGNEKYKGWNSVLNPLFKYFVIGKLHELIEKCQLSWLEMIREVALGEIRNQPYWTATPSSVILH